MEGKKLICFLNSFVIISGGDVRFVEIAKRIECYAKVVVTSFLGKRMCESKDLDSDYLITSNEQCFRNDILINVILIYVKRILKSLFFKINLSEGDILYSTSDFFPDVFPAFILKLRNKNTKWIQIINHIMPHYLTRKGPIVRNVISYYAQKISFKIIKKYADIIFVDNYLLKKELERKRFHLRKIKIIHLGINANFISKVQSDRIKYDASFLARLHPSKGIFDLIKIWNKICKEKPNAKLAIIGGGDQAIIRGLRRRLRMSGLENNIDLLGYIEKDAKVFEILKSSKVFIFPSYEEGFGISICEAMACELPVIAWDLPVYKGIYPKGMIRVPIGNVEKFACETLRLLNENQLHKEMSKSATEVALKYDWDEVAKKELEIWKVTA